MKLSKALKMLSKANDSSLCLKLGTSFFRLKEGKFFDFKDKEVTLTVEEQKSTNWEIVNE